MYIIINNKKYNVLLMNTFLKRLKGLMFKKEPIISIYLFPKCSSIHTYFMKQSIDVCILDKNYCVTYLEKNVKPRRIIIKKHMRSSVSSQTRRIVKKKQISHFIFLQNWIMKTV